MFSPPSDDFSWNFEAFYYGEEIGDEVENFAAQVTQNCAAVGLCDDHVARSSGKVDGSSLSPQQQALKNSVSQLMLLRSQYPSLAKGERRNVWIDESLYADLKVYGDEQILYVLNTSTAERRLSLDMGSVKAATQLKDLMTEETIATQIGTTTIIVPALTGRLLRLD